MFCEDCYIEALCHPNAEVYEYYMELFLSILTFKMCKGTECSSGTVAGVDDVITLGGFVDFRVELLLSPGVAILAIVSTVAVHRVSPLICCLDCGARSAPVLVLPGTPSPVLVVVELRTGVALSA